MSDIITPVQNDLRSHISVQKMTAVHYTTIAICFLMNMLDGMDVLVIAFSAPAISSEWGISPKALGIVFSAAIAGMTIGAMLIAPQGDKIGRKWIILGCAILIGSSVYTTSLAETVNQLMILRFISGLGIGGMLASVSTLAAEYAPDKSKDFWVSLVMGGYPVGAVVTGVLAAYVIPRHGWPAMFQIAGIATMATIPLIILFLSESLEYLAQRRPRNALQKINTILSRMQKTPLPQLPCQGEKVTTPSLSRLFTSTFKTQTLLLWLAFFMAFSTLYFLLSWIPKLTTEAGMPEQLGIYSGTVFNLGAFAGILALGVLAMWMGLRKTIVMFLVSAAVLMMLFRFFSGSFFILVLFGLIGFAMQAGFVGLYAISVRMYPADIRSTGIGWGLGTGRLGAVLGPIVAGYLVAAGLTPTTHFIIFAIPCVIAALAVILIKSREVS